MPRILVFHSYPSKPCIDGLLSAIFFAQLKPVDYYVAYWRTEDCFNRIKNVIESCNGRSGKIEIVYVDCSPEVESEVEFLLARQSDIVVEVFDHHAIAKTSPIHRLEKEMSSFTPHYDADKCVSLTLYDLLAKSADVQLKELLTLVQFSEYDGMNDSVAGKQAASVVAENILNKYVNWPGYAPFVNKIKQLGMSLYFVLDLLLPNNEKWKPLLQKIEKMEFLEAIKSYVQNCKSIINGTNQSAISVESMSRYLDLIEEMKAILGKSQLLPNNKVGDKGVSVILFCRISIFKFGRTLEPLLRTCMQKRGADYAILQNPANVNAEGVKSYYLSLRRSNEVFNACDLAGFVKRESGSTIGGGHPWASGATLDQAQLDRFYAKHSINK